MSNFAADGAVELALKLETTAVGEDMTQAEMVLPMLEKELDGVRRTLESIGTEAIQ